MKKSIVKDEKEIEERIEFEILADCYNTEEQFSAWHSYIEMNCSFPFFANWSSFDNESDEKVTVLEMTSYDACREEKNILFEIEHNGEIFSVPIFELTSIDSDLKTTEVLEDWKFWVNNGGNFNDFDEY